MADRSTMPRHPDPANDALERWGIRVMGPPGEETGRVVEAIQRVEVAERKGMLHEYNRAGPPDTAAHFGRTRKETWATGPGGRA